MCFFIYYFLDFNLFEMFFDFDYFFVKIFDMCCKGECCYGWQKVGVVFKIFKDDFEYLNFEYRRDNGSFISMFLVIFGIKGKIIFDLENVLRSLKVKFFKVVFFIRRYIREVDKFQQVMV